MSHVWIDHTPVTVSDKAADAQWLATYGAAHVRYTRWLYWLMACCIAAYVLAGQMGYAAEAGRAAKADTVPREQLGTQHRAIFMLRPGESACTYLGWRVSREGHVWLQLDAVAEMPCKPSVNWVLLTRLVNGDWLATVKAPVPVNGWDEEYAGHGWWRAERVEVVR